MTAGWSTTPAPSYLGEDEQHELRDVAPIAIGAIDEGVEHRRIVGLYPPGTFGFSAV